MRPETKRKNIQRILNKDPAGAGLKVDGIIGPKTEAAFNALKGAPTIPADHLESGKGSWYSQYRGKYIWIDKGDKPNSNALGVPDDQQGVAFYSRQSLADWFFVTAPNGVTLRLQQTDIGPHPRTGRKIDIAAVAAERFGYTPKNFPTDGIFHWRQDL
jgi:hypothetical protein